MSDIFVSYARADKTRVQRLVQVLEQQGWSIWWDPNIQPGEKFRTVIEKELNDAKCVIVVWSLKSLESEFVIDEATEGKSRGVLIQVLFDDVNMPMGFRQYQAARLIDWQEQTNHSELVKLINSITAKIASPPKKKDAQPPTKEKKSVNPEEQAQRGTTQAPSRPAPEPTTKVDFPPGRRMGLPTWLGTRRKGAARYPYLLSNQPQNLALDPAVEAKLKAEQESREARWKAKSERWERLRLNPGEERAWWISLAVLPALCIVSSFYFDWLLHWMLSLFHFALPPTRMGWWMLPTAGFLWGLAYAVGGFKDRIYRRWQFFVQPALPYLHIFFPMDFYDFCRGLFSAWPVNLFVCLSLSQGIAFGLITLISFININMSEWLVSIYKVGMYLLFSLFILIGIFFYLLRLDEYDYEELFRP